MHLGLTAHTEGERNLWERLVTGENSWLHKVPSQNCRYIQSVGEKYSVQHVVLFFCRANQFHFPIWTRMTSSHDQTSRGMAGWFRGNLRNHGFSYFILCFVKGQLRYRTRSRNQAPVWSTCLLPHIWSRLTICLEGIDFKLVLYVSKCFKRLNQKSTHRPQDRTRRCKTHWLILSKEWGNVSKNAVKVTFP